MKKYGYIKKAIVGTSVAAAALFGAAVSSNAQSVDHEYIKWKNAQRTAEYRHEKYLASNSTHDLHKWQHAQEKLQKRYAKMEKRGVDVSDFAVYENRLSDSTVNSSTVAATYDSMDGGSSNLSAKAVSNYDMSADMSSETTASHHHTVSPMAANVTDDASFEEDYMADAPMHSMSTDSSSNPMDHSSEVANTEIYETASGPSADSAFETTGVSSVDETETPAPMLTGTIIVDDKEIDIETARNTVSLGYMYGRKRGAKDRDHENKYNDKVRSYYSNDFNRTSLVQSGRYKPYFAAGYKKGYEDGFNNTDKYGTVTKTSGQTGYSMNAAEVSAIINSDMSKSSGGGSQ